MHKKRILSAVLSALMLSSTPVLAADFEDDGINFIDSEGAVFSAEEIEFLIENEIPEEDFSARERSFVQSAMRQAGAYNFTKEQIQAMLSNDTSQEDKGEPMQGTLSDDGRYFIYPDGTTLPNLHANLFTNRMQNAAANNSQLTMQSVSFPVSINGLKINEVKFKDDEAYPLMFFNNIVYYPLSYYKANLVNLSVEYCAENGYAIKSGAAEAPKEVSYVYNSARDTGNNEYTVSVIDREITLNAISIDNKAEAYPFVLYNSVVYMPLTWLAAVERLGWDYSLGAESGLAVSCNNFFYTDNGASAKGADGEFTDVFNETRYIGGGLTICLRTSSNKMGPIPQNLSIVKGSAEIRPAGYFGYYSGRGALFSLEDGSVFTVCYTNPDVREPKPCKVNVDTGEVVMM